MSENERDTILQELQGVCDTISEERANGRSTGKLMEQFQELSDRLGVALIKSSFLETRVELADTRRVQAKLRKALKQVEARAQSIAKLQRASAASMQELAGSSDESSRAFYLKAASVHNQLASALAPVVAACADWEK